MTTIDGIEVKVGDNIFHLTRGHARVILAGPECVAEFDNGQQLPFTHNGTHAGSRVFGWAPPTIIWGGAAANAVATLVREFRL